MKISSLAYGRTSLLRMKDLVKTPFYRKKASFERKETSFQSLTPIA